MYPVVLLAGGALCAYWALNLLWQWKKNIDAAKASGLPYTVVPVFVFGRLWLVLNQPVVRLFKMLPEKYRPLWSSRISSMHSWDNLFSNYDGNDAATYLTVSPGGCMLWCANAEAINQMTTRRIDFPKPGHMYRALNIYGRNLVSAEGHLWRRHRKITSPPFTEKNNHLVWSESLAQGSYMIRSWTGDDGNENRTIDSVAHDCMRLTLHVISRAGFGVRLLWPGIQTTAGGEKLAEASEMDSTKLGAGHSMTYTQALENLLHNVTFVVALPHWLLKRLPFKKAQLAWQSYVEWGKYMNEMVQEKKIELASGLSDEGGMDLMGALVKSAGYGADNSLEKGEAETLSDDEIMGNAFVFILAGHETTANTIHFCLTYLAMCTASQRRLQADLDNIFQGRKPEEWDYEQDLPHLFGGMTGAVMNEVLRLIPPAIHIPKMPTAPQTLTIDGREYTVPAKTLINLSAVCVHRNPRYWPAGPPTHPTRRVHPTSNIDNDLEEFRPERWLLDDPAKASPTQQAKGTSLAPNALARSTETEGLGVNTAADTAASLFKPEKGSYIPFSEGFRSCIGRRFAQVEILAVLALIMSQWSVELAVDEWASDAEVERMGEGERREVWDKACEKANEKLRERMGVVITIQLRGGTYIPLRFVRRGKERFYF